MRRLRLEGVICIYILLAVININFRKLTVKWEDKVTPSIGLIIIHNKVISLSVRITLLINIQA
jgi:hypothetical protein